MNLLCPNCQKMLTVPEQYAGQLMKCPLCAGTFTVPGLPPDAPSMPAPAPSQPAAYGLAAEAPDLDDPAHAVRRRPATRGAESGSGRPTRRARADSGVVLTSAHGQSDDV